MGKIKFLLDTAAIRKPGIGLRLQSIYVKPQPDYRADHYYSKNDKHD